MPRNFDDDDDRDDRLSEERSPRRGDSPARPRRPARDEYDDENDDDRPLGKMGKLSQDARLKELRTASWIMLIVGLLTIGVNLVMYFVAADEIAKAQVPLMQKEAAQRILALATVGFVGLGVVFVVFSLIVKSFPVPITVAALVLYLAGQAITAAIAGPETLAQGAIIKVVIIVCLAKAIQAAVAYSQEEARSARRRDDRDDDY